MDSPSANTGAWLVIVPSSSVMVTVCGSPIGSPSSVASIRIVSAPSSTVSSTAVTVASIEASPSGRVSSYGDERVVPSTEIV